MLAACWAALATTTTTLAWTTQRGPFRSPAVSLVATHLSSTTAPASASAEGTTVATTTTTTAMRGQNLEHEHCRSPGDRDILVRAARGEQTERTPVWLMR
jgi:hypothetical protein